MPFPFRTRRRLRALPIVAATLAFTVIATSCGDNVDRDAKQLSPVSYQGEPVTVDGVQMPAQVNGREIEMGLGDAFEPRFWPGVNLGATVPGHLPGDLQITTADYERWFPQMVEFGAHTLRIYTILPPNFYDALAKYNTENPVNPLFVIQGVWIPENEFNETRNAYAPVVTEGFRQEIADAVAVVHGDADLEPLNGRASGTYTTDVSRWVLAYSPGIEWNPALVRDTDNTNAGMPPFRGTYFNASDDATPFESWLASSLDHLAVMEMERGWSRPLTFTNWLTTDPLTHPTQPAEDIVGIDAKHISSTDAWPAGFFASYHAYPYYPDFMYLEAEYQDYRRPQDNQIDPYAGYLNELRQHHGDQSLMITEFGLPTSIGSAHTGPLGRDQGGLSEKDAARHVGEMLSDIETEGYSGAVIFEWVDEWFKTTWNTQQMETPTDRRQYWRNPLTNEEHFGLVATDPGNEATLILDGDDEDWEALETQTAFTSADGPLRTVEMTHDEEYVWMLIETEDAFGWDGMTLAFDPRPGGSGGIEGRPGVVPEADVQIALGQQGAFLKQAAWTDPFSLLYGVNESYVDVNRETLRQNSGAWVELRQLLNIPYTNGVTGQQVPADTVSRSALRYGSGDPTVAEFDDRNLIMANGNTLEIRVPWSYLTYSDPSSHHVYVPNEDGVTSQGVAALGLSVVDRDGNVTRTQGFDWSDWDTVTWHERKKAGWSSLSALMHQSTLR